MKPLKLILAERDFKKKEREGIAAIKRRNKAAALLTKLRDKYERSLNRGNEKLAHTQ